MRKMKKAVLGLTFALATVVGAAQTAAWSAEQEQSCCDCGCCCKPGAACCTTKPEKL